MHQGPRARKLQRFFRRERRRVAFSPRDSIVPLRVVLLSNTGMSRSAVFAVSVGLLASATFAEEPRLLELKVRVGISEHQVREVVTRNLPKLAECIGFADYRNDLAPLKNLDRLDDRVEVQLDVRRGTYADPLGPLHFDARVEGILTDPQCVQDMVATWTAPAALTETIHSSTGDAPIVFIYRYRPADRARTASQQSNAAGMDMLCKAFSGATGTDILSRWDAVKEKLPQRVTRGLERTAAALKTAAPSDMKVLWATAVRETGAMLGAAKPCRAFKGWTYPNLTELLAAEPGDLPADTTCASRVKQMRALAANPPLPVPIRAGEVRIEGAHPFAEGGLVVEDDVYKFDPLAPGGLLLPQAKIASLAVEQAKAQNRKVPIVYLRLKAETPAVAVAEAGRRWRQGFEVRVLGQRQGPGNVGLQANAWKDAVVSVAGPRQAIDYGEVRSTIAGFNAHTDLCAAVPPAVAKVGGPNTDDIGPLITAVADALEKCKCPRIYSEIAWARVSVVADAWDGRAGWVPLPVTDDRFAPAVTLPRKADAGALVRAVAALTSPARIVWTE
jgi:hypothetical protein